MGKLRGRQKPGRKTKTKDIILIRPGTVLRIKKEQWVLQF